MSLHTETVLVHRRHGVTLILLSLFLFAVIYHVHTANTTCSAVMTRWNDLGSTDANTTVLLTGVAGYVGSHTALNLLENGYNVVGVDNMSRGSQRAIDYLSTFDNFHFENVDLGNKIAVDSVFRKYQCSPSKNKISAVIHLASFAFVGESVADPDLYKRNIENNTNFVVDSMIAHHVSNLVFASSCAVYGDAKEFPITEQTRPKPISPYGKSKLAAEQNIISRVSSLHQTNDGPEEPFKVQILRYFNIVGADAHGRLGENPRPELARYDRLWTSCMKVARKTKRCLSTGSEKEYRDYVHVEDVASANVAALRNVQVDGAKSRTDAVQIFNVASDKATSTNDFVSAATSVMGANIAVCKKNRAQDRSASFVQGSAEKLKLTTGWKPKYSGLEQMLSTAWNYSSNRPQQSLRIRLYS